MKGTQTITPGLPVLDAETFQRLLAAAHILQECDDRRVLESKVAGLRDGTIAANAQPIQVVPLTPRAAEVHIPDPPEERVIVHTGAEQFTTQGHWLIPSETAHRFSILASQLEALAQQCSDSQRPRLPVSAEQEIPEEQQETAKPAEVQGKSSFEQLPAESARLIPLAQCAVPSGTNKSPRSIVRRRIFQGEELFLKTATVFAVAVGLFLLLDSSVHRLSPLPGRLAPSSQVAQQQTPFQRTTAPESLATKPVEPTVVADHPQPSVDNSDSSQKTVAKSNSLHITYGSEALLVADENVRIASEVENRVRADRRLQMTQVQVRASKGIVTLSGVVGSDGERVAAAQDAAHIGGIKALVNNLRVITNGQSPAGALQKPSASVAPVVSGAAAEGSAAETSRGTMASSNTHPTDSKIFGVNSSSSPVSTSAMKTHLSEPEQITVPYGTVLAVRLTETLSSDLNQPGDTFLGSLASALVIGDRVIVPEGAGVKGKIVDARNARRFGGRSALVIEVTQLAYNGRTYELRSNQYSEQGASRNAYAAAAITGGTGVGAIIGKIVGKGKGAAIGAVIGAAAGTGIQAVTKRAPAQLRAESTLSFRLETPLALQQAQRVGPNSSQDSSLSESDRPVLKRRNPD